MKVTINQKQIQRLEKKMSHAPEMADEIVRQSLGEAQEVLMSEVRNNASGRPGPQVVTGSYVNSFTSKIEDNTLTLNNSSPQTRRLEYGFYGTDSLGRVYNQPPFPHIRPAIRSAAVALKQALRNNTSRIWRAN